MHGSAWAVSLACGLMAALAAVACPAGPAAAQGTASTGAVIGTVTSQNFVLLEGADVVLEGFGRATTDSQGRCTFSRVPPGNYRLSVHKQGFTGYTRAVTVRAGVTERIDMALAGSADPSTSVAVPLIREGEVFLVRAVLNGRRDAIFIVDTGSSHTTISTAVARELGIFFGPGTPTVTFLTASGRIQAPVTTIQSIQVGGVEARDVEIAVEDQPPSDPREVDVVGLLGNSFLGRFRVRMDPDQGFMILGQ